MQRKTKPRQAVEHILKTARSPLALADIFALAKKRVPTLAFTTVYRIVQKLEAANIVDRVDWRERASRYEWRGTRHHHHLVCEKCGILKDIKDSELNLFKEGLKHVEKNTKFVITDHIIELTGICSRCQIQEQE